MPSRRRRGLLQAAGAALLLPQTALRAASSDTQLRVQRVALAQPPAVALRTMGGEARQLDRELASDVPLVLNFVFTTCSTSCSLQTAVLAQVQRQVAARGRKLRLASITIDPDNDTPEQLRRFAAQFGVAPGWQFYTGRYDDLLRVQQHFDVYRGSKAAHPPVLLLRRGLRAPWVRVEGFPQADEVIALIDGLPGDA